jgi:hypothetical protein
MFDSIAIDVAAVVAAAYLLSPLAVHWTFRFASRCDLAEVSLENLPQQIASLLSERIPEIQELGFALTGCFDCGALAGETHSYVAYFCNHRTNEFANVSVLVSPTQTHSYVEFSTRFTNGQAVETNTNDVLPLTPLDANTRVFRFPEILDATTLLQTHRQLVEKYAVGLWPQAEPRGGEILRLVRVIENYGPRHSQIGYMRLADDRRSYRLTWKGAFLMTWRGMWPVSLVRRWVHHRAMYAELHALENSRVRELQKA